MLELKEDVLTMMTIDSILHSLILQEQKLRPVCKGNVTHVSVPSKTKENPLKADIE